MNKLLSNQRGVAIFIVMAAIAIAVPLVYKFTEETFINRFRADNIESRAKARLVAESALKFAMARLRLYKEAYNFVQNKTGANNVVSQQNLDLIWNFPFIYPIPVSKDMNAIQKQALQKFSEESFLEGGFQLTINNISNKINLNMLRISLLTEARKRAARANPEEEPPEPTEEELAFSPESQLFNALQQSIELKSQNDETFDSKYFGMDIQPLVNELKFYISDPNAIEDNGGADRSFDEQNLTPKRAPITSYSEIYTLPSWPDDIIQLIENEFTVHGALMIDLNEITDNLLRLLIPNILPEDIEEFFKWKNDPQNPQYFNTRDDFKNYIVNIGNILNESDFDERFENYEKQGLKFGPTPTLFKIVINAKVRDATYNLVAYVTMPVQPQPRPQKPANGNLGADGETPQSPQTPQPNPGEPEPNPTPPGGNGNPEKQKTQLLEPRIVEIIVG
ncbi:MAG: hypothetical protein CME65_00455 [Halobacteriovoraceae bacterium]|nr:hypothetical protein [Halobacteriovoraceae bacterium]|tara:strand:+ start:5145 stop:6494 length:1350 start_codon:yes stop_codon:yes gene_type:complete